ncbi:MAG: hypothetical protein WAT17_02930 [Candidatus Saccharimonadales bacterium]|jgi:hypothetical protein
MGLLQKVFVGVGAVMIMAVSAVASYWVMSVTVGREPEPTPVAQPQPVVAEPTELVIKEWSVVIPLTSSISDARYYMSPTLGVDTITITTKRATDLLGKVGSCRTGLYGPAIVRNAIGAKPTGGTIYLQTSGYRFEAPVDVSPACQPTGVPTDLTDILTELELAIGKIHTQ